MNDKHEQQAADPTAVKNVDGATERNHPVLNEPATTTGNFVDQADKLTLKRLLTEPVDVQASETPLSAWLKHAGCMVAVFVPFDLLLSLLGAPVHTFVFWWYVIGLQVSMRVVHMRCRLHLPKAVDTYRKSLRFFCMTLAWPLLLR